MAFITTSQFATEARVTADSADFVDIRFGKDHRVGLKRDEAVTLANDLLDAVRAMDAREVTA